MYFNVTAKVIILLILKYILILTTREMTQRTKAKLMARMAEIGLDRLLHFFPQKFPFSLSP